jgi:hypothetical protein
MSEQEELRDDAPPRDEDDERWQMDPTQDEGQQDSGFEPAASPHEGEEGQRDDVA